MRDLTEMSVGELRMELDKARAEENAAYWRFTRCARSSPLPMVDAAYRVTRILSLISLREYQDAR